MENIVKEWARDAVEDVLTDLAAVGWASAMTLHERIVHRLRYRGIPFDYCHVILLQCKWVFHVYQLGEAFAVERPAVEIPF